MNSLQDFYCSSCKFGLTTQGTTPAQREKRTYDIIESALADYGFYWRPLIRRGVPSLRAKTRKEARNKIDQAKEWGEKNGHPWIETVEDRWDYDDMFQRSMKEQNMTREDMIAYTELGHEPGEKQTSNQRPDNQTLRRQIPPRISK